MSLDTLVNVTITTQTTSLSRAGFGTPLIAATGVPFVGARVRSYASVAEMTDDGFAASDPAVLAAQALLAQNPKVPSWKVGRRDNAWTQVKKFTPTDTTEGLVYSILVLHPDNATTTLVTYTVGAAEAILDITAALDLQFDAISGLTGTDNATDLDVTADVAGALWGFIDLNRELDMKDITADPGVAADLTAIIAEDGDWYGLVLDHKSEAVTNSAAAVIETERKIFVAQHSDSEIKDSGVSDDVFSDLQAGAFARSIGLFHEDDRAFADAAWMGQQFPKTPGSTTWAFKTLAGITVSSLTSGEQSAILAKNGNHYNAVAGVNITFEGKSGSGEFIDITRFVDALTAGLQEDVFAVLVNNEKIAYTDAGVNIMIGTVEARLTQGILDGGLAEDPAPVVTAPLVADVPDADKIARRLPDLNFTATLAGAIHTVVINGVISV